MGRRTRGGERRRANAREFAPHESSSKRFQTTPKMPLNHDYHNILHKASSQEGVTIPPRPSFVVDKCEGRELPTANLGSRFMCACFRYLYEMYSAIIVQISTIGVFRRNVKSRIRFSCLGNPAGRSVHHVRGCVNETFSFR